MTISCDALIIGAGPAGLAASRELSRAGVQHVVLERGDQIGQTWATLYDSLVLHTARGLSTLPGLAYPPSTPLFPSRVDFLAYLHRYADTFRVPVTTRVDVSCLRRADGYWSARTTNGAEIQTRAVVVATGIVSNPYIPEIPGRVHFHGRVLHSVEYRRPDGFNGQRVLVVGAGNSAGEISVELARAGAFVSLAVRTGASILPREIAGIPIQYLAVAVASLPRTVQRLIVAMMGRISALVRGPTFLPPPQRKSCPNVPLLGFGLADALRVGTIRLKGGVAGFTTRGVRFSDDSEEAFDAVILATGYRAAVGMLRDVARLDDCGFGLRRDRVVSIDQPGLYFVGHNYDIRGGLLNIARDARLAARGIRTARREKVQTSTGMPQRPNER